MIARARTKLPAFLLKESQGGCGSRGGCADPGGCSGRDGRGGANASGRRATSTKRHFPNPPPPPPPPTPQHVVQPTHLQSTSQYPDTELSSDSDDDADFTQNYDNLIDSAGASIPNISNNLNTSSSNYYKQSTCCHFLPFGGAETVNKIKLKWQQNLANSRQRKQNASA